MPCEACSGIRFEQAILDVRYPRSRDYRYPNGDLCYLLKPPTYEWCRHTSN